MKKAKGFTVVELLVVVVLIGVFGSIAYTILMGGTHNCIFAP